MMKKVIRNLCLAATVFIGVSTLHSKPAHAWADFCNDTGEKIWVSFGTPNDSGAWQSFGWYQIRDNSCHRFYHHDLRARGVTRLFYLVNNARGVNITPKNNQSAFCVNSTQGFTYTSKEVKGLCGTNGTKWINFAGFNIGNVRNITFTLKS